MPPQNTNSGLVEYATDISAFRYMPVLAIKIERQEREDAIEEIAIS